MNWCMFCSGMSCQQTIAQRVRHAKVMIRVARFSRTISSAGSAGRARTNLRGRAWPGDGMILWDRLSNNHDRSWPMLILSFFPMKSQLSNNYDKSWRLFSGSGWRGWRSWVTTMIGVDLVSQFSSSENSSTLSNNYDRSWPRGFHGSSK